MIVLAVRNVRPDQVGVLEDWFAQLEGPRRDEAVRTLEDEGCRHETALILQTSDGPVLVYAMEVEDPERSKAAARSSTHAVDAEHRAVLAATLGDRPEFRRVFDLQR
jgi:hypothetical protein